MPVSSPDVYTLLTEKVIALIEKGTLPWVQPWQSVHQAGAVSRPLRANGEPYQGINVLMLWIAAMEKGYSAPYWMTYKQAQELGGQVKKGEKSTTVVYANSYTKTEENDAGEEVERRVPFLKTYSVFNVEQIEGLPERFHAPAEPIAIEHDRNLVAEGFFAGTGASIQHGGNSAYYLLDRDHIQMPPFERFRDAEAYYATLAHETTHWTRHPSRLDRDFGRKRFGDEGYAMEELVAELGAAFLCADLGLIPEPREETAAYIQSWLKVLKNDKHAIFTAAGHAQKAADYLHRTVEQAETRLAESYERQAAQEAAPGTKYQQQRLF